MKRALISLAVLLPCMIFGFHAEPDGFRGVPWGTDLAKRPGFVRLPNDGPSLGYEDLRLAAFTRKGDVLMIGETLVDSVTYMSCRFGLSEVSIHYHGRANFNALRVRVGMTFEPLHCVGRPCDDNLLELAGPVTLIQLSYDPTDNKGSLLFWSQEVHKKVADWVKTKDAADSGF